MGCSQLPFSIPTIKVQTNQVLLLKEKQKTPYKIPLPQRLRNAVLLGQDGIPPYLESSEMYGYLIVTSLG